MTVFIVTAAIVMTVVGYASYRLHKLGRQVERDNEELKRWLAKNEGRF